jgi:two-component system sensor histidine kinase KdpD
VLVAAPRQHVSLSTALLLNLSLVFAVAALGGVRPGLAGSLLGFSLSNWYLTPPYHTFSISGTDHIVDLAVFITVGVAVSALVDRAARRSGEAGRARAEAQALARTSGSIISAADPLPDLLDQLCALFQLSSATILDRHGSGWTVNASVGEPRASSPADGTALPLDEHGTTQLVLSGRPLSADDLLVLRTFTDQLALGMEARRLRREAQTVDALAQANALRTALLQAVSHDLRTPLASIKASVSGLLEHEVGFSPADRDALLANIDASADRLDRVIGNLLDMSRLQAGALDSVHRPTALEEVVAAALADLAVAPGRVVVDVPETVPLVDTDGALLERAVANLVSNAVAWTPPDRPVRVEAAAVAGHAELRVIDRGPGIPLAQRAQVFEPFQRLGDVSGDAGVGLGLAIAKGFIEATGGRLELDDTPGGGSTFTAILPLAAA